MLAIIGLAVLHVAIQKSSALREYHWNDLKERIDQLQTLPNHPPPPLLKTACEDLQQIPAASFGLPTRFAHFGAPWMSNRFHNATLYRSDALHTNWHWMRQLPVQGLNSSVMAVIDWLHESDCLVFVWGGSVRDAMLGLAPTDIDLTVTCNPHYLKRICLERFGRGNCHRPSRGSLKLTIGNDRIPVAENISYVAEPIDVAHWNTSFAVMPSKLEYTVNTLAYYIGQQNEAVLVDLSGYGVPDLCQRRIGIPSERQYWLKWAHENSLIKLFRYWKLRMKGFTSRSPSMQQFLIDTIEQNFNAISAQTFYCHYVIGGHLEHHDQRQDDTTPSTASCIVFGSIRDEDRLEGIRKFRRVIAIDFGYSDFWKFKLKPALNSVNLVFM